MKKVLLVPCLLAAFGTSSSIAAPSFTGGYVGALLGYNAGKATGENAIAKDQVKNFNVEKMNSFIYGFKLGYGFNTSDKVYVGADLSGLFNAKTKKGTYLGDSLQIREKMALALMFQVGYSLDAPVTPVIEVGYQHSQFEVEDVTAGVKKTEKKNKGALAYGVGVKFKAGPALLSLTYRRSDTKLTNFKVAQNRILLGATYQF